MGLLINYKNFENQVICHQGKKQRIINSNVKLILLYGYETWRVTQETCRKLQNFVNRCLCTIVNVRLPVIISIDELWKQSNEIKITEDITRRKWNWIGHTLRKENAVEKEAVEWKPQGQRKRERPKRS
jgi:hypothetical protein